MRALVASLCVLTASLLAAPANAQFVGRHDYGPVDIPSSLAGDSGQRGPGLGRELHNIRQRIDQKRRSGILTRVEAHRLKLEAYAIADLADRYDAQGMPQSAQDELEARTHYLSDAVNRPR
ncbi:MAG TPA: hypothetical protein VH331_07385 [Allosphingosinicella sp.]|jgi:hypothetical protein|nr:hypothetical protein [Allosphingosinicella sp.]